jgi:hypothetical protein
LSEVQSAVAPGLFRSFLSAPNGTTAEVPHKVSSITDLSGLYVEFGFILGTILDR